MPILRKYTSWLLLLFAVMFLSPHAQAQRVALKTNAIDWLLLSPNLTAEARLSQRLSLQLGVAANPTHISVANYQFTNFRVEPELRYWLNRPMARHFLALSGTAATYHFRHVDHHLSGDAFGIGVSYGYALVLSDHWNMEAEIGVGVAHLSAKDYWSNNEPSHKNYSHFKPVPIRIGLSFAYIFK